MPEDTGTPAMNAPFESIHRGLYKEFPTMTIRFRRLTAVGLAVALAIAGVGAAPDLSIERAPTDTALQFEVAPTLQTADFLDSAPTNPDLQFALQFNAAPTQPDLQFALQFEVAPALQFS
jgi:hypothetical protein